MLYPVSLKLNNKKCLVVGGGIVAERKVKKLLECGAAVTLVSPIITEGIKKIIEQGIVNYEKRTYKAGDLDDFFLIIACTDENEINEDIYREAESKQKLINAVDNPENCNFYVPATLKRGNLHIAISTSGTLPYLAKKLRVFLEGVFPPDIGNEIEDISKQRYTIIQKTAGREDVKRREFQNIIEPLVKELFEKIKSYAAFNRN